MEKKHGCAPTNLPAKRMTFGVQAQARAMVRKDDLVMTIASDDEISDVEESSEDEGVEEEQELKQAIISKVQWLLRYRHSKHVCRLMMMISIE